MRISRRLLLPLVVLVLTVAMAHYISGRLGGWLFGRVAQSLDTQLGVMAIGQTPRMTFSGLGVGRVLFRRRWPSYTLEVGADSARVTVPFLNALVGDFSQLTVRLERPLVDLVSGSQDGAVLDVGILDDVSVGELVVTVGSSAIAATGRGFDVRTRASYGGVVAWFRDVRVQMSMPLDVTRVEITGGFSTGTVQADWCRLAGIAGDFRVKNETLTVRPLKLKVSERSSLEGELSAKDFGARFSYKLSVPPQDVDLFDVLDVTRRTEADREDFANVPRTIAENRHAFGVTFDVDMAGTMIEELTGAGNLTIRDGRIPNLPLTAAAARLIGAFDSEMPHRGGTLQFSLRDGVAVMKPSLHRGDKIQACVGGEVWFTPGNRTGRGLWAVIRLAAAAPGLVRVPSETLELLKNRDGSLVIPVRLDGGAPALMLSRDYLETVAANGRGLAGAQAYLGSLSTCWPQ